MKEEGDLVYIGHILESINAIEAFSKNMDKHELFSNRLKRSAIIREIEIIGEAVKNLSKNLKDKNPQIDWKSVAGTRDKMIHHYFGVDPEIVWKILKEGIPAFKKQIERLMKELSS